MKLDVAENHENSSFLDEVFLVIMCLDQKNTRFIETCIRAGIHYIDIAASYKLLSDIEAKAELAEQSGSTTVLSVGLAPGISNLLVKHCKQQLGKLDAADIFILLGMGDEHGKVAIEWTVEVLNLLKVKSFRKLFVQIFESFQLGSDIFAVKVDAFGQKDGERAKYQYSRP